jgi:hypothetical protein
VLAAASPPPGDDIHLHLDGSTLWLFNIAMENHNFLGKILWRFWLEKGGKPMGKSLGVSF